MKKHKKKSNKTWYWVLGLILLIVIVGVFWFYVKQEAFNFNSYPYTYNTTFGNATINYYSAIPFNDTNNYCHNTQAGTDNICETKTNVINNNIIGFNTELHELQIYDYDNPHGFGTSSNNIILINKTFSFKDLEKLVIRYSGELKLYYTAHGGWSLTNDCQSSSNNINIYLYNNDNQIPILEYNYPLSADTHLQDTNVVISKINSIYYKDVGDGHPVIFNVSENQNYTILITSTTSISCTENFGDIGTNQIFSISNFELDYKNITNCYPKTCSELYKQCGIQDNGCNSTILCGSCNNFSQCNNNGQCVEQTQPYYDSTNNCSSVNLYLNQTSTNTYTNLTLCQSNIVHNCNFYNNCTVPPTPIYNCTYYNNCSTPSNQTTTCYKTSAFLAQLSFSDIIPSPCNSYNTTSSCMSNFNSKQECLDYYNSQPTLSKLWDQYGFLVSIISIIFSIIVSLIYVIKLFNKKGKKK